jgi:hypothetical protein
MDWSQIVTSFAGLAVSAIAWALQKYLSVKMTEEHRKQAAWAIEQGVAAAAERLRNSPHAGAQKKDLAIKTAETLAPQAMKRLDAAQKSAVADATYARLRPSLPHALHGDLLEHQTERVELPGLPGHSVKVEGSQP